MNSPPIASRPASDSSWSHISNLTIARLDSRTVSEFWNESNEALTPQAKSAPFLIEQLLTCAALW